MQRRQSITLVGGTVIEWPPSARAAASHACGGLSQCLCARRRRNTRPRRRWEGCMIQTSLAKRIALIAAGGLMSGLFAAVANGLGKLKC